MNYAATICFGPVLGSTEHRLSIPQLWDRNGAVTNLKESLAGSIVAMPGAQHWAVVPVDEDWNPGLCHLQDETEDTA
eukprot:scaffold332310_cov25-Prasinocladus_malaysianus.AAC.1